MLERARASVADQTSPPAAHLIAVDYAARGPAVLRNELARVAPSEWLAFLDDDDWLDPIHLEALLSLAGEADVIYPDVRFDGPPLPRRYLPGPFDRDALRDHGCFPITLLCRAERFWSVGGFPEGARYEDWALWNLLADAGARFAFLPAVTWTYCTAHAGRRTDG